MSKQIKIFYAWQSDTLARLNHRFIHEAAEIAIASLNQNVEIEEAESFELDHDTKGVPGMPPIAETICKKINDCTLFLGDLTIVGEFARPSDGTTKRVPNANVLVELGYARRAKGVERLITVMNTAFGDPGGLPFDLAHLRYPIR